MWTASSKTESHIAHVKKWVHQLDSLDPSGCAGNENKSA